MVQSGMDDLRALVTFLPDLQRPDFSAGSWSGHGKGTDGYVTLPRATLGGIAEALCSKTSVTG